MLYKRPDPATSLSSIKRWLAQYKRVKSEPANRLVKRFKKAPLLLPAHFSNATHMLSYARRVRASVEELEQVRAVYANYLSFKQQEDYDLRHAHVVDDIKREWREEARPVRKDALLPADDETGWGVEWPPKEWEEVS